MNPGVGFVLGSGSFLFHGICFWFIGTKEITVCVKGKWLHLNGGVGRGVGRAGMERVRFPADTASLGLAPSPLLVKLSLPRCPLHYPIPIPYCPGHERSQPVDTPLGRIFLEERDSQAPLPRAAPPEAVLLSGAECCLQ